VKAVTAGERAEMNIESSVGRRTTFTVRLPLRGMFEKRELNGTNSL